MNVVNIPLAGGSFRQNPKRIVVHAMGEFIRDKGMDKFAVDHLRDLGLSAHSFVTPSGVVIRCRKGTSGAWHAKGFNTDSLGVEFLVPGVYSSLEELQVRTATPYLSEAQYQAGVEMVEGWAQLYMITKIDRHSDLDPVRRRGDPGDGFPWERFLRDAQ